MINSHKTKTTEVFMCFVTFDFTRFWFFLRVCNTHTRSHALELLQGDAIVHGADVLSLVVVVGHGDLERQQRRTVGDVTYS